MDVKNFQLNTNEHFEFVNFWLKVVQEQSMNAHVKKKDLYQ